MVLIILALQGMEKTDIVLGKTGTLLLALVMFGLAVLNAVQFYKAKNVERLNSALNTTETEMNVYKSRCGRLEKENGDLNQQVGELKAKTDLSAVLTMLSETISLNRESVDLSRKFDRENAQLNSNIVKALEKHGESDVQIFGEIRDSLTNLVAATTGLKDEIGDHRKDAKAMIDGVHERLRTIESKVNRKPHERS